MLERTEQRLDLKPDWLAADTAYGTGKSLAWLLGKNITPHIPVWERYPPADGMFSRSDFTYDAKRDVYVCPNGRLLRTSGRRFIRSRACTTSFLSSTAKRCSTVRVTSRGPSIYSPRMRLASSTARMSVS